MSATRGLTQGDCNAGQGSFASAVIGGLSPILYEAVTQKALYYQAMKAIGSYVVLREVPLGKAAFSRTASGAVGEAIYPALTLWAMDRLTGMPVLLHPVTASTSIPELPEHPNLLSYSGKVTQSGYHFLITELPPHATPVRDPIQAAMGALTALIPLHEAGLVHGNMHPAHLWNKEGTVVVAGAGLHWNNHAISPARDLYELVTTLEQLGYVPKPLTPLLYGGTEPYSARQLLTLMVSDQAFDEPPPPRRVEAPASLPPIELELPEPEMAAPPVSVVARPVQQRPQPASLEQTPRPEPAPQDPLLPSPAPQSPVPQNLAPNQSANQPSGHPAAPLIDELPAVAPWPEPAWLTEQLMAEQLMAEPLTPEQLASPTAEPAAVRTTRAAQQQTQQDQITQEQIPQAVFGPEHRSLAGGRPAHLSEHDPLSLRGFGLGTGVAAQGLFLQRIALDELLATPSTPPSARHTPATPAAPSRPNPALPKLIDWEEVQEKDVHELTPEEREPLVYRPFDQQSQVRSQTVFAVKVQAPEHGAEPAAIPAAAPTVATPVHQPAPSTADRFAPAAPPSPAPSPTPKPLPKLSYDQFLPQANYVQGNTSQHASKSADPEEEKGQPSPVQVSPVQGSRGSTYPAAQKPKRGGFLRGLLRPFRASKKEVAPQAPLPTQPDPEFLPRQPLPLGRHEPQLPRSEPESAETSALALQRLRSDVTRLRDQAAAKRDKLADHLAHFDPSAEEIKLDLSFGEEDFERWATQHGSHMDQWQTPQQRREQERQILQAADELERELISRTIEAKGDAIHFNWPQVNRVPSGLRGSERETSKRLGSTHEWPAHLLSEQPLPVMPLPTETPPTPNIPAASAEETRDYLGVQVQPQEPRHRPEAAFATPPRLSSGLSGEYSTGLGNLSGGLAGGSAASGGLAGGPVLTQAQTTITGTRPTMVAPPHEHDLTPKHWVWPTLGLLLLISANGWAWYYFIGRKAEPSTPPSNSATSVTVPTTTVPTRNPANTNVPDAPSTPSPATNANTDPITQPPSGFVSAAQCCEVVFSLPSSAPSNLVFSLTILQAPAAAKLEVGSPVGTAPGKAKLPVAGEYQIKASASGYADQILNVQAPNGGAVVVPIKVQ